MEIKPLITDEVLQQYKDTCIKWDKVFQQLPVRAANDVLKYFTMVKKLRGKKRVGYINGKSQYAPFKKNRDSQSEVNFDFREIETFHGNVIDPFSPVDFIDLPFVYDDPIIGEAIKKAGITFKVLALLTIARGAGIAQAAFTGKRNAEGDTTEDICDGLLTIADKEVEAGNISAENGNFIKFTDAVTNDNAVDIAKEIVFTNNPFLQRQNSLMFCSPEFKNKYNEAYLLSHHAINYNKQYNQPYVEGSDDRLTLVALPELAGQNRAIITNKTNLLCGIYNDTDFTSVDVIREGHYDLSFASDIWLGFQFHTIDPRVFRYVEFAGE
ncbi:MAG: hypothetical protein K2L55_08385 [Muribaculaceae bacterium]|nr:hypothetical protein [Muribaculaceae bacterium]